jgi:proteic killer suppression protein
MIKSFGCKETQKIFNGATSKKWDIGVNKGAFRKLMMLDASTCLKDLRTPPSNGLHPLKDDLAGFHAIKINKQWRIIFIWDGANAFEVKITDYH